jgi:dUTP pyrophosphatase
LGSEHWSYALRHAVYLKNRLPHTALQYMTPFEKMNGRPPDLSHLHIFGSKAHFMKGTRRNKLDKMDSQGRFMTYKGTDKICYVIDDDTKRERTVTHISYDEAFASVHPSKQPPMASALQQSGYRQEEEQSKCELRVKLLDPEAKVPVKGSTEAAGWDIYCHETVTVPAGEQSKISTKIAIELPKGYHGQLHIRSSLSTKYRARVEAGIIDSDYRGKVFIILSNNSNVELTLNKGERIAQLTIVEDPQVVVTVTDNLGQTERNAGGFGSTGTKDIMNKKTTNAIPQRILPIRQPIPASTTAAAATMEAIDHEPICNIDLSHNPFMDIQEITMISRGNHNTRGLILQDSNTWNDKINIITCKPGTPAAKIKNWKSRLKNSTLLKIDDVIVTKTVDVIKYFELVPSNKNVTLTIGLNEKRAMNDSKGIPMMYYDQLNAVATHLENIKTGDLHKRINDKECREHDTNPIRQAIKTIETTKENVIAKLTGILPKSKVHTAKLTRKKLKGRKDWENGNYLNGSN